MILVVALQYTSLYFGIIILLIYVLLIIGAIITCSREGCKQQEKKPPTSHLRHQLPPSKREAQQSSSQVQYRDIQLAMCPDCEATILAEAKVCPHCGSTQPICIVCATPITHIDSTLSCPYCKGRAHRIHILEYLKVKGSCPNCHMDLDSRELLEDSQKDRVPSQDVSPQHLCMVCQTAIGSNEEVLQCPKCQGKAHRIHILEFIKVKGTCPRCQADLDASELIIT